MQSCCFPPAARIRSRETFTDLIRNGQRCKGTILSVFFRPNALGQPRVGISIGRKYGNAVRRNRFKRVVREAFRRLSAGMPAVDAVIIPILPPRTFPSMRDCEDDLQRFIARTAPGAGHASG